MRGPPVDLLLLDVARRQRTENSPWQVPPGSECCVNGGQTNDVAKNIIITVQRLRVEPFDAS